MAGVVLAVAVALVEGAALEAALVVVALEEDSSVAEVMGILSLIQFAE